MDNQFESIVTHALTALGGSAVTMGILKVWIERKTLNVDQERDRVIKREVAEDKARDDFRDTLRSDVKELRAMHMQCLQERVLDSRLIGELKGQVELLTGKMVLIPKFEISTPTEEVKRIELK